MNTTIFLPKKIKVGYQERTGTYTGKLAYVIYYDQRGKLRKENSWKGWRDNKIPSEEFDNVPTSGFVLNKKVGDYDNGWNHRHAYIRVYDPRNFEFEIGVENLLYILENTSSIKGKGLEGEFVYGWNGKDLVLIPVESPDYKEMSKYNEIVHQRNFVKVKDLVLGGTYKTKNNEEYVYLGRFNYYYTESERLRSGYWDYNHKSINKGKHHFFVKKYKNNDYFYPLALKSLGEKFIEIVSTDCVENYAELFEELETKSDYSPIDESKDEYINYTLEEFLKNKNNYSSFYIYNSNKEKIYIERKYVFSRYNTYYNRTGEYQYFLSDQPYFPIGNRKYYSTLEEIFEEFKPMYRKQYLENGNFYRDYK